MKGDPKKGFVRMPRWVEQEFCTLSPLAAKLFVALKFLETWDHKNKKFGTVEITYTDLGSRVGMSSKQIERAMKELRKARLAQTERRGNQWQPARIRVLAQDLPDGANSIEPITSDGSTGGSTRGSTDVTKSPKPSSSNGEPAPKKVKEGKRR